MSEVIIPGMSAEDKALLGLFNIETLEDLAYVDPEILFLNYCLYLGFDVDRQKLYFCRAICFYAKHIKHYPDKIKWSF